MKYIKATTKHKESIYQLVQDTIRTIYPKYYPQEVVDFFCEHHSKEKILKDIENGCVNMLLVDDVLVGTGSLKENHITRVFVAPKFQRKGYGNYIMNRLEDAISMQYDEVYLDASLSASQLYEHRGYKTVSHEKTKVKNDAILVYEVMKKQLHSTDTSINYDGRLFTPKVNTENGEVDEQTIFTYHQNKTTLWAEYSGGEVRNGSLIGTVAQNGELDFYYQHFNTKNELRVGKCHSVPKVLDNGKIELSEEWQWMNGDQSKGASIVVER